MKRILIISFDFPPQGGTATLRAAKFVKYLPEYGWDPVVLCSDILLFPDTTLAQELRPEVPVYRVSWPGWLRNVVPPATGEASVPPKGAPVPARPPGLASLRRRAARLVRGLLIPEPAVLWARAARATGLQALHEHGCSAIFSSSPPNSMHLLARWLQARCALPWIADFRDVWTIDDGARRRIGVLTFGRQRRLEAQVLAECQRAVVMSAAHANRVAEVFGPAVASKTRVITNGFDAEEFAGPAPAPDPSAFVLLHVGSVTAARTENAFPEGLRLALERDANFARQVRVRFAGEVAPDYRARLAACGTKVEFLDYVEHGQVTEMMRSAALLLLLVSNNDEGAMSMPNKLYEYLAAGRPMLALVPAGTARDLISGEGLGLAVPPHHAEAIAAGLLELFREIQADGGSVSIRSTVRQRFDRRVLAGQLAALLDEVVQA